MQFDWNVTNINKMSDDRSVMLIIQTEKATEGVSPCKTCKSKQQNSWKKLTITKKLTKKLGNIS